jgi:hypothetical protein
MLELLPNSNEAVLRSTVKTTGVVVFPTIELLAKKASSECIRYYFLLSKCKVKQFKFLGK